MPLGATTREQYSRHVSSERKVLVAGPAKPADNRLSDRERRRYDKHPCDNHRHRHYVARKKEHAEAQEDGERDKHQIFDVFLHGELRLLWGILL
jgi:hypothetical protein